MLRVLKILWVRWQIVGRRIADVQARALLVLFYFTAFGALALIVKTFTDPLRLRGGARMWLQRAGGEGDPVMLGRRQF